MPIRVLSEALASRIAAGEVIERPASVVKELIENALDASATRIEISVRDGGIREIAVTDNGSGIPPEEVALAFERFATSKVDESSDLAGIETLGFRGEALPSIASVSHVEVTSRVEGRDDGARLVLEYGDLKLRGAHGAPRGTTVRVSGLFRNVPARLKFLQSPGAELGRIQQLVSGFALTRPEVAFRLRSDGEERLAAPGSGDRRAAVSAVYGARVAEGMMPVAGNPQAAFYVEGMISSPSLTRGNRNYITISVNGRLVQSRRLVVAIEQAYLGFLAERKYPIAVLAIRAPYEDVDVNVHPAKSEVRFLREDLVFAEVQRTVRSALTETAPVRTMTLPRQATAGSPLFRPPSGDFALKPQPTQSMLQAGADAGPAGLLIGETGLQVPAGATAGNAGRSGDDPGGGGPAPHRQVLPVLRVIGQAHETYILAEGPDGVFLVDQHAAHERVMFEEIRKRMASRAMEAQPLLEPEVVETGPAGASVIETQTAELEAAGFSVEIFGKGAVLLRSVPRLLADARHGNGKPGEWLLSVLDDMSERAGTGSWSERLTATLACHSSVRAGKKMTADECRALIMQLEKAEQPQTCPHGRPTMIHLPSGQLERQFGRR